MGDNDLVLGLVSELRRGTLVMLVLSQLKKPMYGYNLVKILQKYDFPIEANTLYPLMRRLESQGLLQSEWETSGAKPRKYYVITPEGEEVYKKIRQQWNILSDNVTILMDTDVSINNGGDENE